MLRRDFLRAVAIGGAGAASLAIGVSVAAAPGIAAISTAHAAIGTGDLGQTSWPIPLTERELLAAVVTRESVDARAYYEPFGLAARDLGITERRVTLLRTSLQDAFAAIIETSDRRIIVWDGVAYRLEHA